MEGTYYNATEDRFGNIELTDDKDNSIYLQGDDASIFSNSWEAIIKIWTRKFGKGYRKTYGPFNSYKEHFDALASEYFTN